MTSFKKGDYIKIKDGTAIENFGNAEKWGGQIQEIDGSGALFSIKFDANTLLQLSDEYLSAAWENGEAVLEYNFLKEDLEVGKREDTEEAYKKAVANVHRRMDDLDDEDSEEEMEEKLNLWATEFSESELMKELSQEDRESANFVADTFGSYAWRYVHEMPMSWDANTVKEVCLHYVVGKVSAPAEDFENYGRILALFFRYLSEEGHIPVSTELQETALEIAPEIPIQAADPRNWHMAKSMMMPGVANGLDLSNQDDLNRYMFSQQRSALDRLETVQKPIKTIKKIGRNDKVSVKYSNGTIKKEVKYKKVMKDVETGKCSLI